MEPFRYVNDFHQSIAEEVAKRIAESVKLLSFMSRPPPDEGVDFISKLKFFNFKGLEAPLVQFKEPLHVSIITFPDKSPFIVFPAEDMVIRSINMISGVLHCKIILLFILMTHLYP